MNSNEITILKARHINKYFYSPEKMQVLSNVNVQIQQGEFVAITGKSGSGKSTLLYILATMDTDYEGSVELNNIITTGKSQNELAALRNKHLGFVFQFHFLLPDFSCLRNVMLPALKLGNRTHEEIEHEAYELLNMLNVGEQALKPAAKLSGGQQQRVAIARALINHPDIIMGDEPTGNLDSKNSENVFEIFKHLNTTRKQTIIVVTHDLDFAHKADRIIELIDGKIV